MLLRTVIISGLVFLSALIYNVESLTNTSAVIDDRIVGGVEQFIRYRKFQVAVLPAGYVCGGSLIGWKWVLSAGHCVYQMVTKTTIVRAGSNHWDRGGYVRHVKKMVRHNGFNINTLANDISILLLSSPFYKSIWVGTITRASHLPANNAIVKVSGYGAISETGSLASSLRSVELKMVGFSTCKTIYGSSLLDSMLCAMEDNKSSCYGDSGGPLTFNNLLVGIVSWGYKCGSNAYPSVYTRVPLYKDWINLMMKTL